MPGPGETGRVSRYRSQSLRRLGIIRIGGHFSPVEVDRTTGVVAAYAIDANGDGRPDILVVEPTSLLWWENR